MCLVLNSCFNLCTCVGKSVVGIILSTVKVVRSFKEVLGKISKECVSVGDKLKIMTFPFSPLVDIYVPPDKRSPPSEGEMMR